MSRCRPGISKDFYSLLTAFLKEDGLSYNAFCVCWREHNMSMIHYGEKELAARRLLLEEMYEHVLSMLHAHREVNMYLFVIYTLFSLTETQILKPRVPVMVDARTWNLLVEFHRTNSTLPSRSDVQRVFNIMVKQRSFTFGVRDKTLIRYPIAIAPLPLAQGEPNKGHRHIPKIPDGLWETVHNAGLLMWYRNTGIPLSELQNSYADYEDALGEVDAKGAVDELSHYNPEFPQDLKTELQKYWIAFDERAELVANRLADDIGNPTQYRKRINTLLAKNDPTRTTTGRGEEATSRKRAKNSTQSGPSAGTVPTAVQEPLSNPHEPSAQRIAGSETTVSFHMPSMSTNTSRPGSRSSTVAPSASQSRASPVPIGQSPTQLAPGDPTTMAKPNTSHDAVSDLFSDSDSDMGVD